MTGSAFDVMSSGFLQSMCQFKLLKIKDQFPLSWRRN